MDFFYGSEIFAQEVWIKMNWSGLLFSVSMHSKWLGINTALFSSSPLHLSSLLSSPPPSSISYCLLSSYALSTQFISSSLISSSLLLLYLHSSLPLPSNHLWISLVCEVVCHLSHSFFSFSISLSPPILSSSSCFSPPPRGPSLFDLWEAADSCLFPAGSHHRHWPYRINTDFILSGFVSFSSTSPKCFSFGFFILFLFPTKSFKLSKANHSARWRGKVRMRVEVEEWWS